MSNSPITKGGRKAKSPGSSRVQQGSVAKLGERENLFSNAKALEAQDEEEEDRELRKPIQTVKVVGSMAFCSKCDGVASFFCSCGTFFCMLDLIGHNCIISLKKTYSKDLLVALR
jgi:hypothetical protein